jgi:hypothetical protein
MIAYQKEATKYNKNKQINNTYFNYKKKLSYFLTNTFLRKKFGYKLFVPAYQRDHQFKKAPPLG